MSKSIENPYPYIYALWTNAVFAGSRTQLSEKQEAFCNNLTKDPKALSTLRASAFCHIAVRTRRDYGFWHDG